MSYDAVVLAGGTARRLDGADKAGLDLAGRTLLERALAAVAGARTVVVVGDRVPTSRVVVWAREEPAYGGPVAAAYAGLDALAEPAGTVLLLAVDMPGVTAATVARLVDAAAAGDGAGLTSAGRRHLALALSWSALVRVRPAGTDAMALRDLLGRLALTEVAALGDEAGDVDTWADLARWRAADGDRTRPTWPGA